MFSQKESKTNLWKKEPVATKERVQPLPSPSALHSNSLECHGVARHCWCRIDSPTISFLRRFCSFEWPLSVISELEASHNLQSKCTQMASKCNFILRSYLKLFIHILGVPSFIYLFFFFWSPNGYFSGPIGPRLVEHNVTCQIMHHSC